MTHIRRLPIYAFLLLLLNSSYLFSFGEPTLFYILNVLVHIGLGSILVIPFCYYVIKNVRTLPSLGRIAIVVLLVGIVSGIYLMVVGGSSPYRWLLISHIISISLGSLLFGAHLLKNTDQFTPQFRKVFISVLVGVLFFPIGFVLFFHYSFQYHILFE